MTYRRGFTLLELLLAMLIFAIIAGTVYSVFSGGIRLSRMSEGRVAVYREAGWAFSLMARELENMARYDVEGMDDYEEFFIGEDDEISFILPADDGLKYIRYYLLPPTSGKIHKVALGIHTSRNVDINITETKSDRTHFLVREEHDFLDILAGKDADAKPEIITGNIKPDSLRIEYGFAEGEIGDGVIYKDKWGQAGIPAKIRITMELTDEYDEQTVELLRDVLVPHGILGAKEI